MSTKLGSEKQGAARVPLAASIAWGGAAAYEFMHIFRRRRGFWAARPRGGYNGAMRMMRALGNWLLDLVLPKQCAGCGREGAFCCWDCRGRLAFSAPACPVCSRRNFTGVLCTPCEAQTGLRRFWAPFYYRDPLVRELIHTYKYGGARELAGLFADELLACLDAFGTRPHGPAVLVPVPLHRSRERERGFNQSSLLAAELAARTGLAVAPALRRTRATEPQVEMESYGERRRNVADSFRLTDAAAVQDRTVILVDDVSTSGATLFEAARVLRESGCRTVWAIVIAKG